MSPHILRFPPNYDDSQRMTNAARNTAPRISPPPSYKSDALDDLSLRVDSISMAESVDKQQHALSRTNVTVLEVHATT